MTIFEENTMIPSSQVTSLHQDAFPETNSITTNNSFSLTPTSSSTTYSQTLLDITNIIASASPSIEPLSNSSVQPRRRKLLPECNLERHTRQEATSLLHTCRANAPHSVLHTPDARTDGTAKAKVEAGRARSRSQSPLHESKLTQYTQR